MDIQHKKNSQPPREFLLQIADEKTKIYCFLWERKNEMNRFHMTWKEILKYYNKNSFHTNLRKLNADGLLSYAETPEAVTVDLVGWEDVMDDE